MKNAARLLVLLAVALCAAACGSSEREPDVSQTPVDDAAQVAAYEAGEDEEADISAGEDKLREDDSTLMPAGDAPVTIACVGDSITWGDGVTDTRKTDSYPAQLQALFDAAGGEISSQAAATGGETSSQSATARDVTVLNFGRNGRTLQSSYERAYTLCDDYAESLALGADIYLILLGSNDATPENWNEESFKRDLSALYDTYSSLVTSGGEAPTLIALLPPCVFPYGGEPQPFGIDKNNLVNGVIPAILAEAEARGLPVIDLFALTEDHPEWFADGVHPNADGNAAIASYIYELLMVD